MSQFCISSERGTALTGLDQLHQTSFNIRLPHQGFPHQHSPGTGGLHTVEIGPTEQTRFTHQQHPLLLQPVVEVDQQPFGRGQIRLEAGEITVVDSDQGKPPIFSTRSISVAS